MSKFVEVVLSIEVRNDMEAIAIQNSVFNGSAAEFVRMGALYGTLPLGNGLYEGQPTAVQNPYTAAQQDAKRQRDNVEVKKVATKTGQSENKPTAPVKEHVPVATGLMGLRRRERR